MKKHKTCTNCEHPKERHFKQVWKGKTEEFCKVIGCWCKKFNLTPQDKS